MTALLTLEGQLRLVGLALVVMGVVHAVLPRAMGWPADLAGSTLLTRQVSYAHLFFIGLVCVLFGLLPLALAPELLAGTRLGNALLAGETVFWGLRWVFQFTVFPARLWRGDRMRTAAHIVLALLWTWVAAVFGYALAATP